MNKRWHEMQLHWAESTGGRLLLHLGCLCRGGSMRFHLSGMGRELSRAFRCGQGRENNVCRLQPVKKPGS